MSIDPGSKNIGLAVSDPTGTIANPLTIIMHISLESDTDFISNEVVKYDIKLIIIGQSLDDNGKPNYEGRRSNRLAKALARKVNIPIKFWNESFTTQDARRARIMMGGTRKKRAGHLDDLAATVILQSYLDAQSVAMENFE
ncbi:MAG: Holliday junction resolvase RuvX [Chloroflexota bacterium]